MKYIVIDKNGLELPIIFPDVLGHNEIVSDQVKILRAGFVSITGTKHENLNVVTYGGSISLGRYASKSDASLIKRSIEFTT